jgi:hypothetical protein
MNTAVAEPAKKRLVSRVTLAVLASVLALASVIAVWSRNQLLDTDSYVATVAPLAKDPVIQADVAERLAVVIIDFADVENRVGALLPEQLNVVAENATTAFNEFVREQTVNIVESEAFYVVWVESNRLGHRAITAVLTGDTPTEGIRAGVIDLSPLVRQVVDALVGRGATFLEEVPVEEWDLSYELFDTSGIESMRGWVQLLDRSAFVLPALTLLVALACVFVGASRRRGVFFVAIGGCAAGLGSVLAVRLVQRAIENASVNDADSIGARAGDILLRGLSDSGRTFAIASGVVALLTWSVTWRQMVTISSTLKGKSRGEKSMG